MAVSFPFPKGGRPVRARPVSDFQRYPQHFSFKTRPNAKNRTLSRLEKGSVFVMVVLIGLEPMTPSM